MQKLRIILSVLGSALFLFIVLEAYCPENNRPTYYLGIATSYCSHFFRGFGYYGVVFVDLCHTLWNDWIYYFWIKFWECIDWVLEYLPDIIRFFKEHIEKLCVAFSRLFEACVRLWFSFTYFFQGLIDAAEVYKNIKELIVWACYAIPLPVFLAQILMPAKWKPSALIKTVTPYVKNFFWYLGYYFMRICMWIYNIVIYAMIFQPISWVVTKIYNIIKLNLVFKFVIKCYNYVSDSFGNAVREIGNLFLAILSLFLSCFSFLKGIRDAPIVDKYCNWMNEWIWSPSYNWFMLNFNWNLWTSSFASSNTTTSTTLSNLGAVGRGRRNKSPTRAKSPVRH